jgi:hypothetical protein
VVLLESTVRSLGREGKTGTHREKSEEKPVKQSEFYRKINQDAFI